MMLPERREEVRGADPDSRARTHLANERTFLAWLRTGLTTVALGLAAGQFLTRDVIPGVPFTRSLSVCLVVVGFLLTLAGAHRYRRSERQIDAGAYRPEGGIIIASTIAVFVVGLLAVVFILLLRR